MEGTPFLEATVPNKELMAFLVILGGRLGEQRETVGVLSFGVQGHKELIPLEQIKERKSEQACPKRKKWKMLGIKDGSCLIPDLREDHTTNSNNLWARGY